MEVCCCGNVLAEKPFAMRVSPCKCETPGPGPSVLIRRDAIPHGITKQHYDERQKLGMPLMTDLEKMQFGGKWQ